MEAVMRAEKSLAMKPPGIASTDLVFAFLPSKAGVGTSTIALNTSIALSKVADTRILLSDFDLNSGVIQFMLRLSHRYSVIDAAQRAAELDEYLWPELVYSMENLDVLHAGDFDPCVRIQATQLHQLMDFARRHYRVICADLSGNLEQYSLELMRESRRVFLVCTPDIASVHLARKKYHYLQSQELGERVSLLLNRAESDSTISTAQIEDIVGLPVWRAFPNDYRAVRKALFDGKPIDPGSSLGRQFVSMAHLILEGKARPTETALGWIGSVSNWLSSRLSRRVPLPVHR
jgi:pilus assembly protein CpaE